MNDKKFNDIMGISGAVTMMLILNDKGLGLNININKEMNWSVLIAPLEVLTEDEIKYYSDNEGRGLLLMKSQRRCTQVSLIGLINLNLGYTDEQGVIPIAKENGFYQYLKKLEVV